jgi:hypothetical protein
LRAQRRRTADRNHGPCGWKENRRELSGEARAVVAADPSILEFTAASGSKLTLGGAPASYTGEVRLFMEGSTKRMAFALP